MLALDKTYEKALPQTEQLFYPRKIKQLQKERLAAYQAVPSFFADVNGLQYGLLQIQEFPKSYYEAVREAVKACNHIYNKTYDLLMRGGNKELEEIGFHRVFHEYITHRSIDALTLLGRYDFAVTENDEELSIKVIEFNSDTPLLIMEAFVANEAMCNHFDVENPNKDSVKQLKDAIYLAIEQTKAYIGVDKPNIVFSASKGPEVNHIYDDSIECVRSTEFLQSLYDGESSFCYIEDLTIVEEDSTINGSFYEKGLYTKEMKKVDILYRHTYPAEFFPEDIAADGTPVGEILIELVTEKKLGLINPPTAFALQSKSLLGLIWGLMEKKLWFDEEEQAMIRKYFLPTYLGNQPFLEQNIPFVQKSSFGRNGDTIKIFNNVDDLYYQSFQNSYKQYEDIFQAYTEMPEAKIHTDRNSRNAKYIVGAFTVMNEPSAIALRVGNEIIDDECYYLPCGIKKD